jgi:hypothetical protein
MRPVLELEPSRIKVWPPVTKSLALGWGVLARPDLRCPESCPNDLVREGFVMSTSLAVLWGDRMA